MKKGPERNPPIWASRLLGWYCRTELLEDLEGDLNEYFERNCNKHGVRYARLMYWCDVLKFIRPYTLRSPGFLNLFIQWIMIGSYVKTAGRSIVRNKLFSTINIAGLAVSMCVGLLLIAFISDLKSYDDFHEKKDRIYRVITNSQFAGEPSRDLASTSVKAGRKIRESISGVEDLTLIRQGFGGDADVNGAKFPLSGLWADQSFFRIFSFPAVHGNLLTALQEPYSIVLTEKSAIKLFGTTDALDKSLKFDTTNYLVKAVIKDVPKFSHLQFDALVSFSTVELQKPDVTGDFEAWESIYSNYVYLVLPEQGDPDVLQKNLDHLSDQENRSIENRKITLSLQQLGAIVVGPDLTNPIGPVFNNIATWILIALACVVILSACFNYTNLSVARSLRRSREVGIRKIIGALKGHVLTQFIAESIIISLLGLVISFLLFLLLRNQFLSLDPFIENLVSLHTSPRTIVYFVTLAVGVGIFSGFLPALFFSRINPIQVLKDVSSLKVFKRVTLRKVLIVVQYTFSLIFITTTIIGYNQYKSFLTYDLGFSTENILNVKLLGNKSELLIKEFAELSDVTAISQSRIVTSVGSLYGATIKYGARDSAGVWLNFVDEHYLPLHAHALVTGKNFSPRFESADEGEIIVNEALLKRFNIGTRDPQKALGEQVTMDGKTLAIVGVIRDFHYGTLSDKIEPMAFRYTSNEPNGYLNLKIAGHDVQATRAAVEQAWRRIDKVHPIEATFYDDRIEEAYAQFSVITKVIGFMAFLAVCISSMGLFGMVVFTTETRLREISIRKVLGASEQKLIYLLSKGFLLLLFISGMVAIPITYLFFEKVVLINFAYHQPVGYGELLSGMLIVMAIAFLMIGSQTLKAARSNPAEVLKTE